MAIFRVVRPARSESSTSSSSMSTSSSSSSSSDDSSDIKQHSKLKRIVAKPAQRFELCDKNTEICQVGDTVCRLPRDLFEVEDLSSILSLDTWNNCLTEKEREKLCSFLPDMEEESFQQTLLEILGGGNINFGNPSVALLHQLKAGMCSPKATKHQEASRLLQRIQHFHGLRQYHNDMVNSFAEMQCVWSDYPEAGIDERMELWHGRKSTPGQPSRRFEGNAHGETSFKERVSSMIPKNRGMVEGKYAEVSTEAGRRVPSQKGNVGNQLYSESGEAVKQNNSKRTFVLVKHSSHAKPMVESERAKINGKKKLEKRSKSGENARTVPGMKMSSNKGPVVGVNWQDVSAKHSSDNRLEQASTLKRQNESGFKTIQATKESGREGFSGLHHADGELSSSEDSDFMAEFMQSEEEPSSRKRLKQDNDDIQDDMYSGASSAHLHDDTPYQAPDVLKSPPSPTPNFSFSVLHLLSAVRASLLGSSSQLRQQRVPPAVPFHEVLRRVQTNPGDFRVLSVQEPLEGLVRGVLKVFSSKTTRPLIQGWKPLVVHDKAARGWAWVGPVSAARFSPNLSLVETDAEAWGISQKMLFKIVDAFATWFNGAQEMLQLFAELGAPPLPQRPFVLNEKDRFQGLRAQRSLITINPTTSEMRVYFQQEEAIRYSLQDTVFFYTTACGEKSAVAPLRRLGGKPNSKARDHLVLRSDRPSHVTILYLVRDAAARLPRSLGTRADVAVLLRDSQYIVDDASDTQLSQVVSGALDRLRYERDPCVQFDVDRKLWVYLHADREEEDFEDDGTSSTKRWKRGKKDVMDSFDMSGQDHATMEEPLDRLASEHEYNSSPGSFAGSGDLNYTADTPELFYNHHSTSLASTFPGQMRDDGVLPLIDLPPSIQSSCTNMQSHPMGWEMYR